MTKKDKIVIVCEHPRLKAKWITVFKEKVPGVELEVFPDDTNRTETEFVLTYDPPIGVFENYPQLKVISSMTAGINHILKDKNLPSGVKVIKVNNALHHQDIALFALTLVLNYLRDMPTYQQQKIEARWKAYQYKRPEEVTVGIMGIGAIGQEIGKLLVKHNFKVTGWSRSPKDLSGIRTFAGAESKEAFLHSAQVLICMLPLTAETRGILNKETFAMLPKGAYVINLARGGHLVEQELEQALASGKLSGAALDVFNEEPLPPDHPFWKNPKIILTPHIAGIVHPEAAVGRILTNYRAMKRGEPLEDVIDLSKGY